MKETNETITYSNWVWVDEKRIRLDDLPKEEQTEIADSLTYRSLASLPNVVVTQVVEQTKGKAG